MQCALILMAHASFFLVSLATINMLRTLLESDYQESPALDSEAISTQAGMVTSGILQNS